jgi:hypothetical protein
MILIAAAGYATSGKDATAKFLVQDWGFKRYAFADILRSAAELLNPGLDVGTGHYEPLDRILHIHGWDSAKIIYPSVRRFLQVMGTEVGRDLLYPDVWVDALFNQIKKDKTKRVVISDCRFPNEVRATHKRGGRVWWISRPGVCPVNAHISDNAISPDDAQYTIDNKGDLVDLRQAVATGIEDSGLALT